MAGQNRRTSGRGQYLPGYIAFSLMLVTTALWTFWGIAELYYEGWGQPFPRPLTYLVPGGICLLLGLIALTWPAIGGWCLIALGGAFTAWRWWAQLHSGGLSWRWVLSWFPVSAMLLLVGWLYLLEDRQRRRRVGLSALPSSRLRRTLLYGVMAGLPLLIVLIVSAYSLPTVLGRYDDGYRGIRLVEGNGIRLMWAPAGPGWNWLQEWGGYPSWNSLALYGIPPVGLDTSLKPTLLQGRDATADEMWTSGLCRYLSADGTTLLEKPQDIWRMPTVDEVVRSLTYKGENAGCAWDGHSDRATCLLRPDKETPLWAPDDPAIYYWTADEAGQEAFYVGYDGSVGKQPKDWGNPRHGYRCVRVP